jgi:hypothetical protein
MPDKQWVSQHLFDSEDQSVLGGFISENSSSTVR